MHTFGSILYVRVREERDEVRDDSNARELFLFNHKMKQKGTKTTRRGKTGRRAENCSSQYNTHMAKRKRISTGLQTPGG